MYSIFTRIFQNILNKYAPLKRKKIRGNQAPFMTKELSKAIMNKSRTRNKYLKWASRENFLAMKKAKNICNKLNKSNKRSYFQQVTPPYYSFSLTQYTMLPSFEWEKGLKEFLQSCYMSCGRFTSHLGMRKHLNPPNYDLTNFLTFVNQCSVFYV